MRKKSQKIEQYGIIHQLRVKTGAAHCASKLTRQNRSLYDINTVRAGKFKKEEKSRLFRKKREKNKKSIKTVHIKQDWEILN